MTVTVIVLECRDRAFPSEYRRGRAKLTNEGYNVYRSDWPDRITGHYKWMIDFVDENAAAIFRLTYGHKIFDND